MRRNFVITRPRHKEGDFFILADCLDPQGKHSPINYEAWYRAAKDRGLKRLSTNLTESALTEIWEFARQPKNDDTGVEL